MSLTTRVNKIDRWEDFPSRLGPVFGPILQRLQKAWNGWYSRVVVERTFRGQVMRRFRRFYYGIFDPGYIRQSVEERREGECHRCGLCCQLIYKCPFLGKDGQNLPYCRIYGDLRPSNCHIYPFDEVDSEIDQCGFKFKAQEIQKSSQS